jgi:mannosyltransferase
VIWHAHRVNELLVGLFLKARFRNVRVVWTRHAVGKPSFFTRQLVRFADRVVAVSPEAAQELGSSSVVIGHGVALEQFTEPKNRTAAFEALQLGGRWGIGVFGRVRPDKGHQDFSLAVRPLLSEHRDWRAAVVGLVKPAEQAWASQLQLPLIGEVTSVERWYQGLTRAEALAAGCCLVTTRLNALDRLLEHGKTGFLYEKGDVAALKEILAQLMSDPALAARVGAAGAELARRELGIDREAAALLKLYRDCLQ